MASVLSVWLAKHSLNSSAQISPLPSASSPAQICSCNIEAQMTTGEGPTKNETQKTGTGRQVGG